MTASDPAIRGATRAATRALAVPGVAWPLELRESPRARRLRLRVDPARAVVEVVVPRGVPDAEARRLVERHRDWIAGRMAAIPPRVPFIDGAVVPVRGVDHVIRHHPGLSGGTRIEGGAILVGGGAEHVGRRVRDFLRALALRELSARAHAKAALVGRRVARVTVRDTRSRWGSCSATGALSFSWRLILAPEPVLDYVVAHEVAHLMEMNHGPGFWRVCARLSDTVETSRAWLRIHGARLHGYG